MTMRRVAPLLGSPLTSKSFDYLAMWFGDGMEAERCRMVLKRCDMMVRVGLERKLVRSGDLEFGYSPGKSYGAQWWEVNVF